MHPAPSNVLIAGGGVAAAEAALALHELAGDRIKITLLAPDLQFLYRPASVLEPFYRVPPRQYSLARLADDVGAELCQDSLDAVDPGSHRAHTAAGRSLGYDALILAYGARSIEPFENAGTIDDRQMDDLLSGLVRDVQDGYVQSAAFVASSPMAWPLPLYELALMTARAANVKASITLVTPEPAPLAVFGAEASLRVEELLAQNGVLMVTASDCQVPAHGHVSPGHGERELHVDRVVALPQLIARPVAGVPAAAPPGFIPIDRRCRVVGLDDVYAAGDATDFSVKHGSIAAQQADTAAGEIAAHAGAAIERQDLEPILQGMLLSGDRPVFMSSRLVDGRPEACRVSDTPLWKPPTKIAARYLGPYVDRLDAAAGIVAE